MNKREFQKGFGYFLAHARNFFFGMNEEEQKLAIGIYFSDLNEMSADKFEYALKKICNNISEFKPSFNFVGKVRENGKGFMLLEPKTKLLTDGQRELNKKKFKKLLKVVWEGKEL